MKMKCGKAQIKMDCTAMHAIDSERFQLLKSGVTNEKKHENRGWKKHGKKEKGKKKKRMT